MSRDAKIVLSFVTVCLAWGCSYYAIRVGLKSMPPLLMGGTRYGLAGLLMWFWCDLKGYARPSARQWLISAFLGFCFVVVGNGTVLWAEQTVPSGITALLVAITPLGTLMFEWVFRQRRSPTPATWIGLGLGLLGIALLVGAPGRAFPIFPVLVVILGTTGWSLGSALSIRLERLESPIRAISAQMLVGSLVLFGLACSTREPRLLHFSSLTWPSITALLYLVFIASIAAYIAYGYLMHHVSPTAAGVCAYVNPIVAMFLGAFAGEPIGAREIVALVMVLVGVGLLSHQELRRAKATLLVKSEANLLSSDFEERAEACA